MVIVLDWVKGRQVDDGQTVLPRYQKAQRRLQYSKILVRNNEEQPFNNMGAGESSYQGWGKRIHTSIEGLVPPTGFLISQLLHPWGFGPPQSSQPFVSCDLQVSTLITTFLSISLIQIPKVKTCMSCLCFWCPLLEQSDGDRIKIISLGAQSLKVSL